MRDAAKAYQVFRGFIDRAVLFGPRAGEVRDLNRVDDTARIEGIDPLLDDSSRDLRGLIVPYLELGTVRILRGKPRFGVAELLPPAFCRVGSTRENDRRDADNADRPHSNPPFLETTLWHRIAGV